MISDQIYVQDITLKSGLKNVIIWDLIFQGTTNLWGNGCKSRMPRTRNAELNIHFE
jgi:hypothetical protein